MFFLLWCKKKKQSITANSVTVLTVYPKLPNFPMHVQIDSSPMAEPVAYCFIFTRSLDTLARQNLSAHM